MVLWVHLWKLNQPIILGIFIITKTCYNWDLNSDLWEGKHCSKTYRCYNTNILKIQPKLLYTGLLSMKCLSRSFHAGVDGSFTQNIEFFSKNMKFSSLFCFIVKHMVGKLRMWCCTWISKNSGGWARISTHDPSAGNSIGQATTAFHITMDFCTEKYYLPTIPTYRSTNFTRTAADRSTS